MGGAVWLAVVALVPVLAAFFFTSGLRGNVGAMGSEIQSPVHGQGGGGGGGGL